MMRILWVTGLIMVLGCSSPSKVPAPPDTHKAHGRKEVCEICDAYQKTRSGVVLIIHRGGIGSGIIVSPSGRIVTAAHIVRGRKTVQIRLFNGESREARVAGIDNGLDLAVLELNSPPDNLTPVPFEAIEDAVPGQAVFIVGHPFGLTWSLSQGIISAVRGPADRRIPNVLQIDAGINLGNSGGPVLNKDGRCLGIVISKIIRGGAESLGFARPISVVREFLKKNGTNGEIQSK